MAADGVPPSGDVFEIFTGHSAEEFVALHRKPWVAAAGAGAAFALVSLFFYARYVAASESMDCRTFSECVAPEGELLMWMLLCSLVVPALILLPARVRRSWLLLLLSPIAALVMWWSLASSWPTLGAFDALLFVLKVSVTYLLLEVIAGYGYRWSVRLAALGGLVTFLVLAATVD